jgi:hypothetical protein
MLVGGGGVSFQEARAGIGVAGSARECDHGGRACRPCLRSQKEAELILLVHPYLVWALLLGETFSLEIDPGT